MSEYNTCFFQHGPACRAQSIARFKINTQNSQLSLRRITFAEKDAEKVSTYTRWYAKLSTALSPYSRGIKHSAEQGDTHTGFTYERGTKCPLFPKLCRPKTCDLPWFFLNFVRAKTLCQHKITIGGQNSNQCRYHARMQKGRKNVEREKDQLPMYYLFIAEYPNIRVFRQGNTSHSLNVNS